MDIPLFPTINASLNALAGVFLFLGFKAIKRGNPALHRRYMIKAFICSVFFLISYLTYHYLKKGVVTHYQGEGIFRITYLTILVTHSILATLIPPAAIMAIVYALKSNFKKHVAITRWLYPVWIYVSVTGVLVYLMLYVF